MNPTESPNLHVRGPADLLAAVPYLLGFHPTESLVVIGLADRTVTVTARINLPDLRLSNVAPTLLAAVKRSGATKAVLVVFTGKQIEVTNLSSKLSGPVEQAGLDLVDLLLVSRGWWRSLVCDDHGCCPAEGRAMPAEPTVVHAAATYAGMVVLPSRESLAEVFAALPNRADLTAALAREQLTAVLDGTDPGWDRAMTRALFVAARAAEDGVFPDDEQVARFGMALMSFPVRDALWLALDNGRLLGTQLWINLARRLPGYFAASPLFLAAWQGYRDGDGARAGIAAELALKSDPMCTAAELLLSALAEGIDPRTLPKLCPPVGSTGGDEPAHA